MVWLAVFLFVVLLVAIAVPNFVKARVSNGNPCIRMLRQIDAAANQFALEKNLKTGDPINFPNDLTPYIKLTLPAQEKFLVVRTVAFIPSKKLAIHQPARSAPPSRPRTFYRKFRSSGFPADYRAASKRKLTGPSKPDSCGPCTGSFCAICVTRCALGSLASPTIRLAQTLTTSI